MCKCRVRTYVETVIKRHENNIETFSLNIDTFLQTLLVNI